MANANEAHVFNLANASLPFLANANEARGFNLVGACLCSPGPMFPEPGSYVPRVLCSPFCMRLGNIGHCVMCFHQVYFMLKVCALPFQVGIVTWPHFSCWSTSCHHLQVERMELSKSVSGKLWIV